MKSNFITTNSQIRELLKEIKALKQKLDEKQEVIEMLKFDVEELQNAKN